MTNAFLTGSRAYGTPHEKSDIDLVVMMPSHQLDQLVDILGKDKSAEPPTYDGSSATACLRFGSLNLLVVTRLEDYQAWREGTDELIARKPVTRDEAVALFQEKRKAALEQRNTVEGKAIAEDTALDAIIAESFLAAIEDDSADPLDNPAILSDEDHAALSALGDDLVDRLIERSKA